MGHGALAGVQHRRAAGQPAVRFANGDRIKVSTVDDDGLPIVRYGTVGAELPGDGPVVVMFDDLLGGDIVDRSEVEIVSVDSIALVLQGPDLATDPVLRAGLAAMWAAEVDLAGLETGILHLLGDPPGAGLRDAADSWVLAEFSHEGSMHVVRALLAGDGTGTVVVHAGRMNRWDGFTSP